jgi:exodeoxyribonuclease-3
MRVVKVVTWNVNGIRARMEQVVALIAEEKPDVLCLQEIKAAPDQLEDSLFALSDYFNYWHGAKGGYSGVSLHVRRGAFAEAPAFSHPPFDTETRIVVGAAGDALFASVYVPNGGKDYAAKVKFLGDLAAWVGSACAGGKTLVLCGDLNVALEDIDVHPSQRSKPGHPVIGQRPEERELFGRMLGHGMVDVGRTLAPDDERLFTWWPYWRQARERNLGWRIDYVLASRAQASRATSCEIRRTYGSSDHAPVVVMFADGATRA